MIVDRVIAIGIIVVIGLIGLYRIFRDKQRLEERKQFAYEFNNKLMEYVKSGGKDNEAYGWLISRSPKMQSELGELGIARNFRPPFANYVINNYQMVVNFLPEIRREFTSGGLTGPDARVIREYGAMLNETMIRYAGVLDDRLEPARNDLRNPIKWFREGIQYILILPFILLNELGIIGGSILAMISRSGLFKLIAGVLALLALLSTIITIVTGWDAFVMILNNFLDKW